jgi:rhamnulose-1-phosphate aldolase/alcohol dehydrogenase
MDLKHLRNLWDDNVAQGLDEPDQLRYRSNLLGSDLRLTNFGGGNTSAKVVQPDPITGEDVTVLWVKGSGGDLGSIKREGFATLYLDKLLALKSRYRGVSEEDAMADKYALCTFDNNPRAASIDTPLHGFLPYRHVDHLHPDWAIALAASANGPDLLTAIEAETGLKLGWLPWKRPGFELGLWLERAITERPDLDGIILGSHGLFTWGDTSKECYEQTLHVIDVIGEFVLRYRDRNPLFGGAAFETLSNRKQVAAELMPRLRGKVGPSIGNFSDAEEVMEFVNSVRGKDLAYQGTSCPDHFVRTRVRPLFLDDLDDVDGAFESYAREYGEYYQENKQADSPAMRGSSPTVVLVPGVGMFSFGKTKAEARITGEFYTNAINVMAGATSMAGAAPVSGRPIGAVVDNYVALPPAEAFGIEYWLLEEAKLQRLPAEREMSRKVAVLVGASPGIGRNVAERLLTKGCHLVLLDLNSELASVMAHELMQKFGRDTVSSAQVDITDRESIKQALDEVVMTFGGIDVLVTIAAVFIPPTDGKLTDNQWKKTYEINVLGSLAIAEGAKAVIDKQQTDGSIVLVSSANAVVPKAGSVAYDTSKAAVNHLVRELAVEFGPRIRVNAVAPATVVEGSQMFPRERVIGSLQKYGIDFSELEPTFDLRARLAAYYSQRTILKKPVTPARVADAICLLASDSTELTTGHVIPVDAGLPEAFLR